MKVNLLTDDKTLEQFHQQADTRKQSIRVDREAFSRLLVDYNAMYTALHQQRQVTVPAPKRTRPVI